MGGPELKLTDDARRAAGAACFDYLELLDPFRPDLFRYCRKLASVHHSIENPRGYLVRIASNLWVDRIRRRQVERAALAAEVSDPTQAPGPRASVAA